MSAYDQLRRFVHDKCGISVSEAKDYLLRTRLEPLAALYGLSIEELAMQVTYKPEIERAVIDAMTTNETSFFRDVSLWKVLQDELLPELRGARPVSVWSAACSTGQEAYSLAILAKELQIPLRVHGTDIAQTVVDKAKSGTYTRLEVNRGLSARRLLENFTQMPGDEWRVADPVKFTCSFARANLLDPVSLGGYDLVLLRNVLIYFEEKTRQTVFRNVADVVRPGGYLILGASEGLLNVPQGFERTVRGGVTVWARR